MATVRTSVAPENDSSNQKEWRETQDASEPGDGNSGTSNRGRRCTNRAHERPHKQHASMRTACPAPPAEIIQVINPRDSACTRTRYCTVLPTAHFHATGKARKDADVGAGRSGTRPIPLIRNAVRRHARRRATGPPPAPADTLNTREAPHASRPACHPTAAPRAPAMAQRRLRRESPLLRRYYFFSGSGLSCDAAGALLALTPLPGVNGKVANIVFAWFCICSCICTNMFFDCSI